MAKLTHDLKFLAPFCSLTVAIVWTGIFDNVYNFNHDLEFKQLSEDTGLIWTIILFFLMGACFWRVIRAWRLTKQHKITQLDCYFITVLNGLGLLQFMAYFLIRGAYYDAASNDVFIRRMTSLSNWSMLPFLGWCVLWSRHLRRGWNPKYVWAVSLVTSFSYFLVLIHRGSFYFLLGIAVSLSGIALYETYKVHFYRANVKTIFYSVLCLHVIFYIFHLLDFILFDYGWSFSYVALLSFALITSLTNRLYVTILVEVNEHKF